MNETFFKEIDNEEKAYWLGMIAADGHIRGNSFYLNFAIKDEEHLDRLRKTLEIEKPLVLRQKVTETKTYYSKRLHFANKIFTACLEMNGIPKGAKSLILKPPSISFRSLRRHWIRGYFDGDGSIGLNTKKSNFIFGVTGTLLVCRYIKDYFNEICGLELDNIYHRSRHHKDIFRFQVRGNNQVYTILSEMYKDAHVFLERKHDKFLKLIELRNSYTDESNKRYNRIN